MNLLDNVVDNYQLLIADFIGISFSIPGIVEFFLNIIVTIVIFIVFYLLGNKVRQLFFRDISSYNHFISIALGYIFIGTGIGILGIFSLLNPPIITGFLLVCLAIAFYPKPVIKFKTKKSIFSPRDMVVWVVVFFVSISFLRLMTPETAEDGYHTDLPILYLSWQTTIHESRDYLRVIPYPQLPEMIYLIPIFLGEKEITRFIHFGFYLLIIALLYRVANNYPFAKYAPLLFVTTPLVIRYSPSQYTDFFAIFCFLLAVLIIPRKLTNNVIILAGIFFGAVVSTKIWMLVYLPIFFLYFIYLTKKNKVSSIFKFAVIFYGSSLTVSLLWHIRAYLITGNPIFPILSKWELLGASEPVTGSISTLIGLNTKMFSVENMIVYSPLIFFGLLFAPIGFKKLVPILKKFPIGVFISLLLIEQLIIQVYLGRYLLTFYTLSTLVVSAAVYIFITNKYYRYAFRIVCIVIAAYYFINTLLILPYGFGWADKNKYLTRVLGRDNVSYYNFDGKFDKWIAKDDLVATFGIGSYYYSDFSYIDMGYIFNSNNRSFDLLDKRGVTKILIKGGDMEWLSKKISMTGYDKRKVKLLATYPHDVKKYNLYSLEK